MTDYSLPPALLSLLEGKNAELKQMHFDVRVGNLQGSRVVSVREVLAKWAPEPGSPLHELWLQVKQATELYTDEIQRIYDEAEGAIPGVTDPDDRPEGK